MENLLILINVILAAILIIVILLQRSTFAIKRFCCSYSQSNVLVEFWQYGIRYCATCTLIKLYYFLRFLLLPFLSPFYPRIGGPLLPTYLRVLSRVHRGSGSLDPGSVIVDTSYIIIFTLAMGIVYISRGGNYAGEAEFHPI